MVQMFKLSRLFRLARLQRILRVQLQLAIRNSTNKILKFAGAVILCAHWMAHWMMLGAVLFGHFMGNVLAVVADMSTAENEFYLCSRQSEDAVLEQCGRRGSGALSNGVQ